MRKAQIGLGVANHEVNFGSVRLFVESAPKVAVKPRLVASIDANLIPADLSAAA
jgi:hypothetical protein